MVYSLLNASALGFDIVRRPAAERLADVLLTALTAPPLLLWELAAAHPAADLPRQEQREWLAGAALVRGVRAATAPPDRSGEIGPESCVRWSAVAQSAARLSLGKPGELDRLIAVELLGPAFTAADVPRHLLELAADALAEAAVAEWMATLTDPPTPAYGALVRARSSCGLLITVDLGPGSDELTDLLAALPDTAQQWADRRPATTGTGGPLEWAEAMHEASWAIEVSGRTRPAAGAQLMASARLAMTGLDSTALASWVWNPVSALVAATVVGDLLPDETVEALVRGGRTFCPVAWDRPT